MPSRKKSPPPRPEHFLEHFPPDMRAIANRLREIVKAAVPDVTEAVIPGWKLIGYRVPSGRKNAYFCMIVPEREHVHLGFEWGVHLPDPDGVLQGDGTQVRYFTIRSMDEVDEDLYSPFIQQAAEVALMPKELRAHFRDAAHN